MPQTRTIVLPHFFWRCCSRNSSGSSALFRQDHFAGPHREPSSISKRGKFELACPKHGHVRISSQTGLFVRELVVASWTHNTVAIFLEGTSLTLFFFLPIKLVSTKRTLKSFFDLSRLFLTHRCITLSVILTEVFGMQARQSPRPKLW